MYVYIQKIIISDPGKAGADFFFTLFMVFQEILNITNFTATQILDDKEFI